MEKAGNIRALLFDLGGVVIEIDFARAVAAWQPHSRLPPEALRQAFVLDDAYRRHEAGALDDAAYFAYLRGRLGLECADADVRAGWNAIFVQPIEPTLAAIDAVRGSLPCYALSNTNAAHIAHLRSAYPGLLERFEHVFVSHEIGCRKPQPEAFAHVARAIGAAPAEILFFDDLAENVAAARACGLQAVWVRGPQDVLAALA